MSILQGGIINRNNLSVHQGLLSRTPELLPFMPMAESKRNKDMINRKCILKTKETNEEERRNRKKGSKEV